MQKLDVCSRNAILAGTALILFAPLGVTAANHAPSIAGQPATYAPRDVLYVFTPRASDVDHDRLTFSIVNKPKWMWFDTRTGTLKGRPKWAQRNRTFKNIVIRVSDGQAMRALPAFSIKVSATSGTAGNSPPTISGRPPLKARIGQPYYFRPTARDANGDRLSFSIVNKPAWARFSPTTGALSGTPTAGQAGTYQNVTIRVWDGKATTTLPPYAIVVAPPDTTTHTVTLNWTPPVRNADGSALTDLAGYRIYYGTAPRTYSNVLSVSDAAVQSAELQGLASGSWYFAIRSVNQAGAMSDLSAEVRATL